MNKQFDWLAAMACSREKTVVASVRMPCAFSSTAAEAAGPEKGSLMAKRSLGTPADPNPFA